MGFCLPKFAADTFKQKLKSGEINPAKLSDMTSKERREFFKEVVGEENAEHTNALFESKLLLKNQQAGIIRWAKELTGIKPEVKRDIESRVNRMQKILEPKELDMFLEDLAARRLGVGISAEEGIKIAELAKAVGEKRTAMEQGGDRMDYGRAKVALSDYVDGLKLEASRLSAQEYTKHPGKALVDFGGFTKSLKASLDNSAIFRQGWKTMFTNPQLWMKNAATSFKDIAQTFRGKDILRAVKINIIARPTYDAMVKAKLAIGTVEEAYPSTAPERIPYLGRPFHASQVAYTGFIYRQRADIFDKYLDIAKKSGLDITDKQQLESIGKLVNSLTGRGKLGVLEPAADVMNNVFFAPRFIKSHIDVLTAHVGDRQMSSFAHKQAAINLAKVVAGTALILAIANALKPGSVEKDPRSTDFGKIKIGDSRFDVTGGMASVLTLAARLSTNQTKSSTSGNINELNTRKFGSQTTMDVIYSFLENKASPLAAVFIDYARGQDRQGNPVSVAGEAKNLLVPLPVTNYLELKNNPNSAPILAALIADGLGISTNTYAPSAQGVVNDKAAVTQEVLEKMAAGDEKGATALAHEFNVRLKDSIRAGMTQKDNNDNTETLDDRVQKAFDKDALYIPDEDTVADYKAGGKDVVASVANNGKPTIVKDTPLPSKGIVGTVIAYAHAIGVDPQTAFHDIFKGQRILKVENGTVIVERMSVEKSQAIKAARGGKNAEMKLDHTLPLSAGGTNEESNLKLVTTEEWESYTPVENEVGTALRSKKIDKKTAQKLIIDFKRGLISADDIHTQLNPDD